MAKDSSKGTGGGGGAKVAEKPAEAKSVEDAVARINSLAFDETQLASERSTGAIGELDSMPKGTVLSLYREGERGVIESQMTYEKQADGTWKNTTEGYRYQDALLSGRIYRNLRDSAQGTRLNAGEIDTSSHVEVTGKPGKAFDGIRYANGTYDTNVHARNGEWGKVETTGKIATYNGTQYGVKKSGGEYLVTHIPTGVLAGGIGASGKLRNYTDVSKAIKAADKVIHQSSAMEKGIEQQAENFKKMRRLKSSGY